MAVQTGGGGRPPGGPVAGQRDAYDEQPVGGRLPRVDVYGEHVRVGCGGRRRVDRLEATRVRREAHVHVLLCVLRLLRHLTQVHIGRLLIADVQETRDGEAEREARVRRAREPVAQVEEKRDCHSERDEQKARAPNAPQPQRAAEQRREGCEEVAAAERARGSTIRSTIGGSRKLALHMSTVPISGITRAASFEISVQCKKKL